MVGRRDEHEVRAERARLIGLFRYQLIREAADPELSSKVRGRMVRAIAAAEHVDPFGRTVRISRDTLDRWIRAWRRDGFDALVPVPRQSSPRTPSEVLELAIALKRENPQRTAAQVRRVLRGQLGWSPSERTLQRHFAEHALTVAPEAGRPVVFGRFEASRPNELWTGDALHALRIGGRKTYLFAFLDDLSAYDLTWFTGYDLACRSGSGVVSVCHGWFGVGEAVFHAPAGAVDGDDVAVV
ncbi:helix-turn-helix domain-containing protein [Haloechinothrix salitolerans]|uniref:Helix-turn-helix domain-containing protein n=1 Tax=Haloechinothrix salitolerans TaxID=926830 RepID=A0ABW2C0H7_9PSEU